MQGAAPENKRKLSNNSIQFGGRAGVVVGLGQMSHVGPSVSMFVNGLKQFLSCLMLFCPPSQMVPRLCLASSSISPVYTERLSCLFVFYLEKRNTLPIYHNIEHCIIQKSWEKSKENNKKEKEIKYSQSATLAVAPLHSGAGLLLR